MTTTYTHLFTERGNGFPPDAAEVLEADDVGGGSLWIVRGSGMIQTHGSGDGNTVPLICEPSDRDWDDLTEDEQDALYQDAYRVARIPGTAEAEPTLTASTMRDGVCVADQAGGVWWPAESTQAIIQAADDPEAEAIAICRRNPGAGIWRS